MNPTPVLPIKLLSPTRPRPANRNVSPKLMGNLIDYMQEKFNGLLKSDDLFREHIEVMQANEIKAVVFGGWARDRVHEIINSADHIVGDIDMVAVGKSSIVDVLGPNATPTVFGGAGIRESTIYFDAWDLPNTYHIKKHSLSQNFETLPATADYTFNSIIFKPEQFFRTPEIYETGAISAIEDKIVDFQSNEIILPIVQASRSVNLAAKLNFELSVTVTQFLREICEKREALKDVLDGLELYCSKDIIEIAKKKLAEALIFQDK